MLLEQDLQEYCSVVDLNDGPNSVNNYAAPCLALASTCKNKSNAVLWKSSAHLLKKDLIDKFDKYKSFSITDRDVKMLVKARDPKFIESKIANLEATDDRQTIANITKPDNTKKSFDRKPSFTRTSSFDNNKNSNPIPGTSNAYRTSKISNNKNSNYQNIEDDKNNMPGPSNVFRTAKSELILQQMKKKGTNGQDNQQLSYGSLKRSLGPRRGITNKFIPPIANNNKDR